MKEHWSWPIVVLVVRIVLAVGLALGAVTADDILTEGAGVRLVRAKLDLLSKSLAAQEAWPQAPSPSE